MSPEPNPVLDQLRARMSQLEQGGSRARGHRPERADAVDEPDTAAQATDQAARPNQAARPARGKALAAKLETDPAGAARDICLNLLAEPRTRAELHAALRKRGIADDIARQTLDRLTEAGVINDALYARLWVESRSRTKGFGRARLRQELTRKGIADHLIDATLAELDPEAEYASARELVAKRMPGLESVSDDTVMRRLGAQLVRRGLSTEAATRIVSEALDARRGRRR